MKPPFRLTPEILHFVSRIERLIGRIEGLVIIGSDASY
jgi:hypothetical protein